MQKREAQKLKATARISYVLLKIARVLLKIPSQKAIKLIRHG